MHRILSTYININGSLTAKKDARETNGGVIDFLTRVIFTLERRHNLRADRGGRRLNYALVFNLLTVALLRVPYVRMHQIISHLPLSIEVTDAMRL